MCMLCPQALAGGVPVAPGGKKVMADDGAGIELALNPDELDLDSAALQAKYYQQMKEQQSHIAKEDLSDMVAEHNAKQKVHVQLIPRCDLSGSGWGLLKIVPLYTNILSLS